jgi:hypothetical protein
MKNSGHSNILKMGAITGIILAVAGIAAASATGVMRGSVIIIQGWALF